MVEKEWGKGKHDGIVFTLLEGQFDKVKHIILFFYILQIIILCIGFMCLYCKKEGADEAAEIFIRR